MYTILKTNIMVYRLNNQRKLSAHVHVMKSQTWTEKCLNKFYHQTSNTENEVNRKHSISGISGKSS